MYAMQIASLGLPLEPDEAFLCLQQRVLDQLLTLAWYHSICLVQSLKLFMSLGQRVNITSDRSNTFCLRLAEIQFGFHESSPPRDGLTFQCLGRRLGRRGTPSELDYPQCSLGDFHPSGSQFIQAFAILGLRPKTRRCGRHCQNDP